MCSSPEEPLPSAVRRIGLPLSSFCKRQASICIDTHTPAKPYLKSEVREREREVPSPST